MKEILVSDFAIRCRLCEQVIIESLTWTVLFQENDLSPSDALWFQRLSCSAGAGRARPAKTNASRLSRTGFLICVPRWQLTTKFSPGSCRRTRNHAASENNRVRGKSGDKETEEILLTSMPSVRTRSSTRGFVRKNLSKASQDGSAIRILRSGKIVDKQNINWRKGKEEKSQEEDLRENDDEISKSFGIIYGRKRSRSKARKEESSGSRYGIVFVRKHQIKRVKLSAPSDNGFSSMGYGRRIVLVILIRPGVGGASYNRFNRLIFSLLTAFRKKTINLFDCAEFLSSGDLARAFSLQGIHFLPIRGWENDFSLRSAFRDQGACLLFGASDRVPLVSLDFSVLPLFFSSLHLSLFFSCLRLSSTLETTQLEISAEERRLLLLNIREEENRKREVLLFFRNSSTSETRSFRRTRSKKRQRRSNFSRRHRHRRRNGLFAVSFLDESQRKRRTTWNQASNFCRFQEDEQRFASCTANVLVVNSDRCWREKDAKITLEREISSRWRISVQSESATRYIQKNTDPKLSCTNRYTHSLIWAGEPGWKLEFCDRRDWIVFKELHRECFERNSEMIPVKIIPVPVVREVPGYEESFTSSFIRPDSYIRTAGEVEREMKREKPYDMDSGDEDWLGKLNASPEFSGEAFESVMSAFEKAAYSNPESCTDQEKALDVCPNFAAPGVLAAVFEYWLKKRKQRRAALIRAFQVQPPKNTQPSHSSLRKKQSFKRLARGNSYVYIEGVDDVDFRKAEVSEVRARKAVNWAARLRTRAQVLMVNAEWSTLKSMMAVRIAEAARSAETLVEDTTNIFV